MKIEKGALEEEEKGEGKSLLVGIQIDSNGRELLNWVLRKVSKPGDRIVAVHVCTNSDLYNTSTSSLIKLLDDYLAVYESLCNLKQVVLVGRISRGSSIRKVLVREAELCSALTVVVGVNKKKAFGGSVSIAKYCAKKLPPTTSLLAVQSGKIIFERAASKLHSGEEPKPNLRSFLHPSIGMDPKVIIPSCKYKPHSGEILNDRRLVVREQMAVVGSSSISLLVRTLPEPRPGWPLLRRAVSANSEALRDQGSRNMSVVQWVMRLPNRSFPSPQFQLDMGKKHNLDGQDSITASVDLLRELEIILLNNSSSCKWFQHEELQLSTSQFSSENLIGNGGSSRVYKGCFPNGQQVAIKLSPFSEEASRDFLLEVDIITTLQHERIVPLMGICVEENNLISVYSFFSKGSLEENLHGRRAKNPLPWDIRFKVAIGVAEALSYLHNSCSRPVIHRDVKSANILLSDEFEPRLSDFGLAVWAPTTSSYLTHSDVVGTFGYLAPEYFMYGKVSDKIDVYAFGVVLLELLTGRKPISDDNPKGQESLVMWATPILERGDVVDLLDPNLDSNYDEDQMRRMVLTASLCITRAARLRPQMNEVLKLLRGEEEVSAWMASHANNNTPNELDWQDEETYPASSIRSHLSLALLDAGDDVSVTSFEPDYLNSLEEYLRGRWSRSSSFD